MANEIRRLHNREHVPYGGFAILYRTNAQSRIFEDELRRQGTPYRIYGGMSFYQRKEIKDIRINSPLEDDFSPYILNVSFIGARAEVLLHLLEDSKIYVATGSACTSKSSAVSGSYVIKALGLNNKEVESAIRFSFGHDNKREEVDKTIEVLKTSLMFLRRLRK